MFGIPAPTVLKFLFVFVRLGRLLNTMRHEDTWTTSGKELEELGLDELGLEEVGLEEVEDV